MQSVSIVKGVLQVTNKQVAGRHYAMQNKSDRAKTVLIEQPKVEGWELVGTDKPAETTDKLYRFERKLAAGESADFVVTAQSVTRSDVVILSSDPGTLQWYTTNGKTPQPVKDALVKVIALRQQQADLDRQINDATAELAKITQEQQRIRENMKTVDKGSAYYTRLMNKLDEQENTIEKTQGKVADLTASRDAKRGEVEAYLNGLSVE